MSTFLGELGADKVTEFFEKFINIKVSLFLGGDILNKFVSENMVNALDGNSQADPLLVSKAMAALASIYRSSEYHNYVQFIGDIRKIKRLLNIILLLEIDKTNFEYSDIDQTDLIHLLLIYINYPGMFRKIYNSETGGSRGFFSAVIEYEPGYPDDENNNDDSRPKNSTYYAEYVKGLSLSQKYLLDKVFDVSARFKGEFSLDMNHANYSEEAKYTYACFNGGFGYGKNLEAYLNLIVKLSKPLRIDQYRFYQREMEKVKLGVLIEDIFKADEFSSLKSENSHRLFWRAVVNSAHDIKGGVGEKIINYILDVVPKYSFIENEEIGIGVRDDLVLYLLKFIDIVGWSDENGNHKNNTPENVSEIADWIFGEGTHHNRGILRTLASEERGVLGLHDLMIFRLYCCADRGGGIFNVCKALSLRGDSEAPVTGELRKIVIHEMREVSQEVFCIFKKHYILPKKNFFECIDDTIFADLAGERVDYIHNKIDQKVVTKEWVDLEVEKAKSLLMIFILYQMGNTKINSGIGCGYYDEVGKEDNRGIAKALNEYLFGLCFHPSGGDKNYEYFVDYLLRNYLTPFETGSDPAPNLDKFLNVLDREMLKNYWFQNGEIIKNIELTKREKEIVTTSYRVSYKQDLEQLFEILDDFVVVSNEPFGAEGEQG